MKVTGCLIVLLLLAGCAPPADNPPEMAGKFEKAEGDSLQPHYPGLSCFIWVRQNYMDDLHWAPSPPGSYPVIGYQYEMRGTLPDTSVAFLVAGSSQDSIRVRGVDIMGSVSEWSEWSDVINP